MRAALPAASRHRGHPGRPADCAEPGCGPWPVELEEGAEPCQCWPPGVPMVPHAGHCCFARPVICHKIPARWREELSCRRCGYPMTESETRCGLCAQRGRPERKRS